MKKIISQIKKEFSIANWVYIALFSLVASKSIFINPFTKVEGVFGILLGVLLVAILFVISVIAIHFISKVGWQRKDKKVLKTKILLYMIPGIVVSVFMWLCYWPAIVPFDTAWIWDIVTTREYNNLHPLIYIMFVKYIRLIWDSPIFFVLIQIIYCSFVYGYIGYVFEKRGLKKAWVWVLVCFLALLPVNAIHTVTILKDIPYIMGLIFISALLFDYINDKGISIKKIIILLVAGLIAIFSRHNAMLTIPLTLAFAAFLYLLNKDFKKVLCFGFALVLLLGIFFGTEKVALKSVKGRYYHKPSINGYVTIPSAQMVYIVSTHWGELSQDHINKARYFVNMDYVFSVRSSTPQKLNYNFNYYASMNEKNIVQNQREFLEFYISLIREYPLSAIKEYENITAIAWCIPNNGYTVCNNSGIAEYYGEKIAEENSMLPEAKKFLDNTVFNCEDGVVFLWRPALPMLLSLLLLVVAIKRHKKLSLLVLSPAVFNMFGYMIVCPSQNVRYFYCNASIFVIFLVYSLMLPQKVETEEKEELIEG